jgi:peptidoglycan/xylan/chitin deacetylase (PgdA/CDA1 family)
VPLVIKMSRRRVVSGAFCAGLVLLAAGCSVTHSGRGPVFMAPSTSPAPLEPAGVPGGPARLPSHAPSAGAPSPGAVLGPPVGWRLSDIPRFPPPPAPERITLGRNGRIPVLSRLPVTQPVAFLTIDDGYLKPAEAQKLFAAARVPVTLFLTTDAIRDNVAFFDRLRPYGAVIESHTISHPNLRDRPYQFQTRQVCGSADRLAGWYGRRPVLFRPPFGEKDATTLRAAGECGIKAVLLWKETVHKGKVRYQEGNQVRRGDIILMHFRPAFAQDFIAALQAIHRAGLTPALLEDYLPG